MRGENTTESKANIPASSKGDSNVVRKNSSSAVNKVLILVIVLLVGVVGVMAYQFTQEDEDDRIVHDGRGTFVTPENAEDVKDSIADKVEGATYTTSMTIDWNFYDGKSVSTSAYVENVEENSHTVYFDVYLSSTGEKVYSSPYLPLGTKLDQIALDVDLPAGDYPAIVKYVLVDEEHKEVSAVSVAITIHIKN